jgi:hypothetical protein
LREEREYMRRTGEGGKRGRIEENDARRDE